VATQLFEIIQKDAGQKAASKKHLKGCFFNAIKWMRMMLESCAPWRDLCGRQLRVGMPHQVTRRTRKRLCNRLIAEPS
ncbi:hypothetical protein ABTK85_19870, partial [Acinetobacter baumannii]